MQATNNQGALALRALRLLALRRERLPKAVLPRRPLSAKRTNTKRARGGLRRTHSPWPSAVGVAVARLISVWQLTQR